jgi:hypothetical protein
MLPPHETAYPRLKNTVTEAELAEIYTPTPEEIAFAEAHTQSETAKVGILLSLKTFGEGTRKGRSRAGWYGSVAKLLRTCCYPQVAVVCSSIVTICNMLRELCDRTTFRAFSDNLTIPSTHRMLSSHVVAAQHLAR